MSTATFAIPFDTLAFVKKLETAGVPSSQAEAQVEMLSDVLQKVEASRTQELATKGDVREAELRLEGKIESVRKDIEAAKSDTLKWTAGMFAAQTALIIGAMFAVMKMNQPVLPAAYQPPAQEMRQQVPAPALQAPPTAPAPTQPAR
ncbi:MAG: CCDC90 family protein [Magnetococcus sp. DMHC-8]